MKLLLIALIGAAAALSPGSGKRPGGFGTASRGMIGLDEISVIPPEDVLSFMSFVREFQRIFAHSANYAQLQAIFEGPAMIDWINARLGHGDGRIDDSEFAAWHSTLASLWQRFGMSGQEVIAEEWMVTDTNKDGHITPLEIYTMLRDEKAAKFFPSFFSLIFAEHAKGQPFWSQAKADDFRRNTPWAQVLSLPMATDDEIKSEAAEIAKTEGPAASQEFAINMNVAPNQSGTQDAEPEENAELIITTASGQETLPASLELRPDGGATVTAEDAAGNIIVVELEKPLVDASVIPAGAPGVASDELQRQAEAEKKTELGQQAVVTIIRPNGEIASETIAQLTDIKAGQEVAAKDLQFQTVVEKTAMTLDVILIPAETPFVAPPQIPEILSAAVALGNGPLVTGEVFSADETPGQVKEAIVLPDRTTLEVVENGAVLIKPDGQQVPLVTVNDVTETKPDGKIQETQTFVNPQTGEQVKLVETIAPAIASDGTWV